MGVPAAPRFGTPTAARPAACPAPAPAPARLTAEPSLRDYHLLPSVRGDLLMKLGRPAEAQAEFERAASLTSNIPERELSQARARAAASQAAGRVADRARRPD